MRVRLTRKLAQRVDGIDLSPFREGDVLDVSVREAELLVAEGWAVPVSSQSNRDVRRRSAALGRAEAADTQRATNKRRLQALQHALDDHRFEPHQDRRLEDRIRDELHDTHTRIVDPSPDVPVESASGESAPKAATSSPSTDRRRRTRRSRISRHNHE